MKTLMPVFALLLAGCASSGSVPALKQYLVRSDVSQPAASDPETATLGLGSLTLASYVDQPGLVIETATGEVHVANHHQWAEPLRESLRGFLASEIGSRVGQRVRYQSYGGNAWKREMPTLINVHISQLHGGADGAALLAASWTVEDRTSGTVEEHVFRTSEPIVGEGYSALVRAEKRALEALAAAIAARLRS